MRFLLLCLMMCSCNFFANIENEEQPPVEDIVQSYVSCEEIRIPMSNGASRFLLRCTDREAGAICYSIGGHTWSCLDMVLRAGIVEGARQQ